MVHGRSRMTIASRPLHPHNAGTERIGFSPTMHTFLGQSAKAPAIRMKRELHPTKNRLCCRLRLLVLTFLCV